MELTITIVPAPERSNAGSSALVTRSVPSTFTSYIHCQSPTSAVSTGSRPRAPPALFTSSVTGPGAASAAAARPATDSSEVTSQATAVAVPPAASIWATSAASRSVRRAAASTWNPSAASRRAVAAPIPLDAPVTMATEVIRSLSPVAGPGGGMRSVTPGTRRKAFPYPDGEDDIRHTG